MKTNSRRIILDVAMAVLLILMYNELAISLRFHEVGGLVVCGLFVFHNLLNRKWIVGISNRLFNHKLATRVRVGYALDVLLLFTMATIAISGIMISKTVLLAISGDVLFWRHVHYFASAVALVLIGVHIGLHWSFIRTTFAKFLKIPRAVARPLGALCLTVVLAFGVYAIATSSFLHWIEAPFEESGGGNPDGLGKGQGGQGRGLQRGGGSGSAESPLMVIVTYGSIVSIPAALTVVTESGLKKRKAKLALQPA
ncbi:MAG: DUF4405 domain-containing protein [Dehalococcoidia bacterium]|nr:DUF4405 domain-containing protein [Dehalococcoidia bacterium]